MAPLLSVVFLGAFLLVGLGMLGYGVRSLRTGYEIRTTETDAPREVIAGEPVDLEGQARVHEETLEAPFSGRACLGYEYKVEEYRHDDDGSNWHTVDSGTEVVPFLLDLGNGSVLVDAKQANVDIDDDQHRRTVGGGNEPPKQIKRFIAGNESLGSEDKSLDLKIAEIDYGSRRRYTENVLLPDETCFVSGVGRSSTGISRRLPREASAAVGPPREAGDGGRLTDLRQWLDPLTFYVADAPKGTAAKRQFFRGALVMIFGLVFGGIAAVVLVSGA